MLIALIVTSGLALHINHNGKNFDPVKEVKELISQNRRDDALDLVETFRDSPTVDQDTFYQLEQEIRYSNLEKIKSFSWDGVIKGKVYDTYSGLGALTADLCVYGDIRDTISQSWKYLSEDKSFDKFILILSAAGLGLSGTSFLDGVDSLAKNTVKYLKHIPTRMNKGALNSLVSKGVSSTEAPKVWDLLVKNSYSIPKTASNLSNISSLKHLDTATEVVGRYKKTGTVFINLAGDNGLSLFSHAPKRVKDKLIRAFKENPRAILGLTKTHLFLHSTKFLYKHDLVALLIPVSALAIPLSHLPSISWTIFIGSSIYLSYLITQLIVSTTKTIKKMKGEQWKNQNVN